MQYQFTNDVTVQGVQYRAGDIADKAEFPAGSLECLLRRWVVEYTAPAVEADPAVSETQPEPAGDAAEPTPQPSPKKKGGK